jgi:Mg-chelatase subunit ChlD
VRFRALYRCVFAATAALALAYVGCGSNSDSGGNGGSANGAGAGGSGQGGTAASNSGGSGAILLGGSGGTAAGGGSGGGGGSSGDACAQTVVNGTLKSANLLFVIDRSGSMNCNLPSDGQPTSQCESYPAPIDPNKPTKWQLTKDALEQAIDDLLASGTKLSAGLVVFPRPGTDCAVTQTPDVPIVALDAQQDSALKTFLDSVSPKGNTPLAGATILSYAHLYDELSSGALSLDSNTFVVLLTDGYETCKTDEIDKLINQDVPNALSINIRTFVIGVPGSENGRALLSQVAWQGGTAKSTTCTHDPTPVDVGDCHFDMTMSSNFGPDLQAALAQISGTVLSCEIDVPPPPAGKQINPADVTVTVDGQTVPEDDSKPCNAGAEGWQFSADKSKIYLCGTACDTAKTAKEISLDLGCLQNIK